ncbi:18600_t:CDS:2 [Acaulospora morrowiae]|uniref:18600_t:CDS:1 n=1 Tax=Acaulospora morrowiae TaxID=94023 RepID=A0A9N9DNT5_9GLOM|nr:18600_t:CDS:2 [Acaulospora morrowiae]
MCFATETETEKEHYVKECSTTLNFLFLLTKLPDLKLPEDKLQEYFIGKCKTFQTFKNSKLEVQDSYSIPLLATQKSDFVFIAKGDPLNALHVIAVRKTRTESINLNRVQKNRTLSNKAKGK